MVTTAAGTFTADRDGDGDLVVLLHGFPQSRHTWREQLPALANAGFCALAYDQRGYSPGVRPDPADLSHYSLDRLVQDVIDVSAALGVERFHLVGHDWGGAVAWVTADRHPDRIGSLTVLSRPHPSAFRAAFRANADDQQHRSRHHTAFHDPETGPRLVADDARRLRRMLADNGVPAEGVAAYASVLGTPEAMEAALAWYRAAGALTSIEAGLIAPPTLYLWGDDDLSVGRSAAERTAQFVDGAYRFIEVSGGGHFLTDDQPETVTTALLEHLAAHPL